MKAEKASRLDEAKLLNLLSVTFNPHWSAGKLPEHMVEKYRRRDFFTLKNEVEDKAITVLTGPRQVGKTTLMYQLMNELVNSGKDPKRVLYMQMDDTSLQNITEGALEDSLDVYSRYVLKEPLSQIKDTVYVFLDEIQHLENWPNILKTFYDRKYNMKFFLSGSSSTDIYEASNPLMGRMKKKVISTMKFSDFAGFYLQKHRQKIIDFSLSVRTAIGDSMKEGGSSALYKSVMEEKTYISGIEDELKIKFDDYMLRGGYPGLLNLASYSKASEQLKNNMDLAILDLVKRYQVRNPAYFEKILYLLSDATSKNVNYSSISKNIGIDKVTVTEYVEYLRRTYLISLSKFFSASPMKRMRKDYKVHINDTGLRNAIVSRLNETLLNDKSELGKVLETCMFNHAQRLQFYISNHETPEVGYTQINGKEIDIILSYGKSVLPIEVKIDGTRPGDESALKDFMDEHGLKLGIIITGKTLKLHDNILLMPAWMFALCC